MLFGYASVALLAALLPPVIPPSVPGLRVPIWYAISALAAGVAVLLTVRPDVRRSLVLVLGWLQLVLTVLQAFLIGDLIAMFCTWLAVPALALLAGQLRPRPRRALVTAHVISSASSVGIAVVIVAMSVVAMTSGDIHTTQVTYELMAAFDITLLPRDPGMVRRPSVSSLPVEPGTGVEAKVAERGRYRHSSTPPMSVTCIRCRCQSVVCVIQAGASRLADRCQNSRYCRADRGRRTRVSRNPDRSVH
jgi:hypothetical protein